MRIYGEHETFNLKMFQYITKKKMKKKRCETETYEMYERLGIEESISNLLRDFAKPHH